MNPVFLQATANWMSSLSVFLIPLILLGVMYFMMIRPQKKQEKKLAEQRANLKVGDRVVSIGGIMGRVVNLREDEVTLASSVAGTLLTFRKEAINQVIPATEEGSQE